MKLGQSGSAILMSAIALVAVGGLGVGLMEQTKTDARLKRSELIEESAEQVASWLKVHLADKDFCKRNVADLGLAPNDYLDIEELFNASGEGVLSRGELDTSVGDIAITSLKFREIEVSPGVTRPYFTIGFNLDPNQKKNMIGAADRKMNFLLQGPRNPDGTFNGFCFHDESTHVLDTLTTACQNFGGQLDLATWRCDHQLGTVLSSSPSEPCNGQMQFVVDSNGVGGISCVN